MKGYCNELLDRYRAIGNDLPGWAFRLPTGPWPGAGQPLRPTIPFVGRHYPRWGGILVYASAENLTRYEHDHPDLGFLARHAGNRHRAWFRRWALARDSEVFFPDIHIQPCNDGSLLAAVAYYILRRFGRTFRDPRRLLESIAVANFGKFSIRTDGGANKDYATNLPKLLVSLPYVCADLAVLRPGIIIVPRTIFQKPAISKAMLACASSDAVILPLSQMNARVARLHLSHLRDGAARVDAWVGRHSKDLATWIEKSRSQGGYGDGELYCFLAEMAEKCRSGLGPLTRTL